MRSFSVVSGEVALAQQFSALRADARGGSFLLPHQQLGAIALPTNPTNSQTLTLTINGNAVAFTFVSAIGATAGNVLIGASAAATAANLLALLNQPQTTTATGVALSGANQTLVNYLSWSLSGTTITPSSNNNSLYAPLSSFTASTTATGASWTAQTMALYVEPGVVYVNGTRVIWSGGSSPTITGPVSNPRIDLLTIDNTGTLALTTGSENASPSAPTYPADKVVLCEIYNVVSEAAVYDNENQTSGQGYVYHDVRPILGLQFNPSAITDTMLPASSGGYDLGSASFPWGNVYTNNLFVNGASPALARFGGTGADGALSVSSGTTTIDCSNAALVVKNYTSISITGTGTLAFSNPNTNGTIVILRSQGAVTLTSSSAPMIDMSGMGGAAGALGTTGSAGTSMYVSIPAGVGPTGLSGGAGGTGPGSVFWQSIALYQRTFRLFTGAGGGGGATQSNSGGGGTPGTGAAGGNGGGALVIECGGALNFTTSGGISVAGKNGSAGVAGTGAQGGGGGGGGGAGGSCFLLYNSLTSASGTITATGGTGGAGGNGSAGGAGTGGSGGSGGNGQSGSGNGGTGGSSSGSDTGGGAGGGGAADSGMSNGSAGGNSSAGSAGGGGGGGASGYALVAQNTFFA